MRFASVFLAVSGLIAASVSQAAPIVVYNTDLPTVSGTAGDGTATTTTNSNGTTTTVNGSAGGANRVSATPAFDQWQQRNVGGGGTVGITNDYGHSGNGSAFFQGVGSSSKSDLEIFFSNSIALSSITGMSYDWFRAAASNNPAGQHIALRLQVDFDGNVATNDRAYLIYELAYNGGGAAPENAWQTALIGANSILWSNTGLPNPSFNMTLEDWQTDYRSALVVGLSLGLGSGWDGFFEGAADNVTIQRGTQPALAWNFEVAANAVPEPGSLALVGLGLAGIVALRKRKTA